MNIHCQKWGIYCNIPYIHCQKLGIFCTYTVKKRGVYCMYTVRNEEYTVHTLSEMINIPYIHCQKWGICHTYTVRNEEYTIHTVSTVHYIPPLWQCMYTYTVYSSFLQCMYSIFIITDSVCTVYPSLLTAYLCTVYSSFLTVYVRYIPHFWQYTYSTLLVFLQWTYRMFLL